MKLPTRLENAITKLYNAFHKGELNALDCTHCAVGNICNNNQEWQYTGMFFTEAQMSKKTKRYKLGEQFVKETGYSVKELIKVESLFMGAHRKVEDEKESQFKGLCAVVEYLCSLDGIPNVMDYTKLFETNSFDSAPKYKLEEVL